MKVSIIIPAYNEEKRIAKTLDTYLTYFDYLKAKKEIDYEIIVSINGTTDSTEDVVRRFVRDNRNIFYLNLLRGGKGYAVIEGFKAAFEGNSDLIGFVDADMATQPSSFYNLVKGIKSADGIIASRYVRGAIVRPRPTLQRILVSRLFNILIRGMLSLNYRDTQCGAKLFRRDALRKVLPKLTLSRWAFDVDLLYQLKKSGFKVKEVPTIWSDKEYSKINLLKSGPLMLLGIIRLRMLNSPFKRFIAVYDLFFDNKKIKSG